VTEGDWFRDSSWCTQNRISWVGLLGEPQAVTPAARSPCPGHPGAPKGAGRRSQKTSQPQTVRHTGQQHCRRARISHWRGTSSCQQGKKNKIKGKTKKKGKGRNPRRLCTEGEWLAVLFLRISPCVISTWGSAGK